MAPLDSILNDVLSGFKDSNIAFSDMVRLLKAMGFKCRIRGDHYIFKKEGTNGIINIQPAGSKMKPYQVKQIRYFILTYRLSL